MGAQEHPLVSAYRQFSPTSESLAQRAQKVFPGGDPGVGVDQHEVRAPATLLAGHSREHAMSALLEELRHLPESRIVIANE